MKRVLTVCSIAIALYGCSRFNYNTKITSLGDKVYKSTQTEIPHGMMLIPGKEGVEDFCISTTEEPNIFYGVYLQWLINTYNADYPEVLQKAFPLRPDGTKIYSINDPYIKEQFFSERYAYYPIVNLNWRQIQKYIAWKNDRYNEYVLIREGILKWNPNQVNEDNFNTESYFAKQYEGLVKSELLSERPGEEFRKVEPQDGFLALGFRLPTYEEWKQAKAYKSKHTVKIKRNPNNYFPLGKGNSVLQHNKNLTNYNGYFLTDFPFNYRAYEVLFKSDSTSNYVINGEQISPVVDLAIKTLVPMKLNSGVKEWLEDGFNPEGVYHKNWMDAMMASGYDSSRSIKARDHGGWLQEKDSLGHMVGYRHYGYKSKYKTIILSDNPVPHQRLIVGDGTIQAKEEDYVNMGVGFRIAMNFSTYHKF